MPKPTSAKRNSVPLKTAGSVVIPEKPVKFEGTRFLPHQQEKHDEKACSEVRGNEVDPSGAPIAFAVAAEDAENER